MPDHSAEPEPPPLLPELWPLTGAYAFLDAKREDVEEMLTGWRRGLDRDPQSETLSGPLLSLLRRMEPLSLGYRELLLGTDSRWTAYFSDQRTGADESPVGQLARFLRCRAVYLVRWPVPGFEALRFQLIADHKTEFLNYERVVAIGTDDDGRMIFEASGQIQPYEDEGAYRARRVRDRLTPRMVDHYCRQLGIRPFDESFFRSEGVLVTSRDYRPDIRFEIADQQARYGFRPSRKERHS